MHKIGEYIKIRPNAYNQKWFTAKPILIKDISYDKENNLLYITNCEFMRHDGIITTSIFSGFVIQDEECLKLNRENKLKRILK